ncbi:uncharacterized protein isoform X1 [Leptinotarsa decemlineata]|uniref:uncharacterized protein isoform X1 n=1 Tax=Leptinotarsa decemlineata TaxID=7539 RepID=UPI000C254616|nr:uncharacterized protein LOC111508101 isoform X1 [Leptinotarsa decemlineata]
MKVDVELMFECLMYLNAHYYPVFAISEASMTIAKHISEKKHTPNLDRDAMVCSLRLFIELAKLILFKRYKDDHRKIVTAVVVFMTMITVGTVYYTVFVQDPTLKLENVFSCLTIMLMIVELVFGIWFIIPCNEKVEYYY